MIKKLIYIYLFLLSLLSKSTLQALSSSSIVSIKCGLPPANFNSLFSLKSCLSLNRRVRRKGDCLSDCLLRVGGVDGSGVIVGDVVAADVICHLGLLLVAD